MAHRFDRRKDDVERQEAAERALKWHNNINRDLIKQGLAPCGKMVDAIEKGYEHDIISSATYDQAQNIRRAGNEAKHKW